MGPHGSLILRKAGPVGKKHLYPSISATGQKPDCIRGARRIDPGQ